MNNRRLQYEERASASPLDYDNWFDYLRLEESAGDLDRTREVGGVCAWRATWLAFVADFL